MALPLMRLVIDTNVLVSALLNPTRAPDRCLSAVCARGDAVLFDHRIVAEYRAVLARPKFSSIAATRSAALVAALLTHGEDLGSVAPYALALVDDGDRLFIEVALAGRADAIVTGNAKHYPAGLGFDVIAPASLLAFFGG